MNHRDKILTRLRSVHGAISDCELMNLLQNNGAISDLCVKTDDIADSDLIRAYNDTFAQ